MKKILVLSDSHGAFNTILNIYEKELPDIVIYTGDGIRDIEELSYVHNFECHIVNGNCDIFEKNYGLAKNISVEKLKIFITHGHIYGVKSGLEKLKNFIEKLEIDIVIYGHTHKEYLEHFKKSYIFNPGASQDGKYGIILMEDEKNFKIFHKKI